MRSNPLALALQDPWAAMQQVLDGPLHPGGRAATEELLDRAGVTEGTRLLDVGCGAGTALQQARDRGAVAVGLDRDPGDAVRGVRGDLGALPVRENAVDVVLAECVLCLAPSLADALAEAERVLDDGGRLALSDVVAATPPDVPESLAEPLCLTDRRDESTLLAAVEDAGFAVDDVRRHREDLLAMRDRFAERVDYRELLAALGDRGQRLLDGVETLEAAVEAGDVGYVSLVATADGGSVERLRQS